jgi:hypothetical protein
MISDVLVEAYDQIQEYLNTPEFADVYAGKLRDEIERLLKQMDTVRSELDRLPAPASQRPEDG